MSDSPPASARLESHGVHVLGDFVSQCGISQSARDVLATVQSLGWPVESLDLPLFAGREQDTAAALKKAGSLPAPAAPISILNLNADGLPALMHSLPASFSTNRYLIGIWFWETEIFPPHQRVGFDYVDEVWVASKHIRDALEKVSPVPVRQFTPLVHPPSPTGPESLPDSLKNDRFMFLFCFDYRSSGARKNPAGTCEAFVRAFPEPTADGPLCVIKTIAAHPGSTIEYLDLQRQFRHRPDIIFMDGWLTLEQRDGLMNRADCYVSLHRAEGLGLTILESMSLGKPCIGTAYSGNMDFMNADNSWLIPCSMVPVGLRRWPFPKDHTWAEPDLAAAAAAMQEAFSNPTLLHQKGDRARETVLTRHSPAAVGEVMRGLLKEAIQRPVRPKPGLESAESAPTSSYRAQAIELLKQAKAQHKSSRQQLKALKGWNVSAGLKETLEAILEVQKLQLDVQTPILRELGAIRQHQQGFDQSTFDHLIHDQARTGRLLKTWMEDSRPQDPA